MKKVDNFNPGKWLVENKITTQSRLNEMSIDDTFKADELANKEVSNYISKNN